MEVMLQSVIKMIEKLSNNLLESQADSKTIVNIENLINVSAYDTATNSSSPIITCGASRKVESSNTSRLFVGNIRERTLTEHDLYHYFSQYGNVVDAKIIINDGIWRGFGFVQFDQCARVISAVHQRNHVIKGYSVYVEPAIPKCQSTRGSTAGDRWNNYFKEKNLTRQPASYDYYGSGAFDRPNDFRYDASQVDRSADLNQPMERLNSFGYGNRRHHVGPRRGLFNRK